ncbi:unnamed protein product [Spirodela intermedia]|uniref:Uncharacterized protein n=1 Tax=Spirodela intermedia TaxID=51605 RepID=A0A7I8JWN2_SPIIN|nr:unnamed protein product [Spirodela intermedia]
MAREGKKNRVNVLVKSTLSASLPVKPGKTYPLATLDHAMAHHSLHLVFYYPAAAVAAAGMGREPLRVSLSEVLVHYPAVGGRLTRPAEAGGNWVVRCNDAGMRVLDAQVRGTMEDWWRTATPEEEKELAQWETTGEDVFLWSPFTVQISEFECGGLAIGLSCAHMYADPMCVTLLVKAWGDAHRRACIVHPPFFHSPALRARPTPNLATASVELLRRKASSAAAPAAMSTATFRFSDQSVRRCLAQLRPSCPDAAPFVALAALFWWRLKGSATASGGPQSLTLCRDIRKLLDAPLPHGFFGNALHFSAVTADLADGGWGGAAEAIRAHLDGVEEEEVWSTIDWVESRRDPATETHGEAFQMYGPELTCACLDNLFSYSAAFGAEATAPSHVAYHVGAAEGEGLILVLPAPPEQEGTLGRTVTVSLPQDQMDKIRHDPVILDLGPTVLLNSPSA